MTPKIKDRWINAFVAALAGGLVAFFAWGLSSTEGRTIRINDKLDKKADTEWVKDQDELLRKDLVNYKGDHQIQHGNEYLLMMSEVESVRSNQEQMMQFWGIAPLAEK